jgi:hypothetical protein
MDRRADVVDEARQRQLGGANAAADGLLGFPHEHASARPGQRDGASEPVRPRTDDDGVVLAAQLTSARTEERASRTISRAITSRWISFVPS